MEGGVANSVGADENSKLNRHNLNKEKKLKPGLWQESRTHVQRQEAKCECVLYL